MLTRARRVLIIIPVSIDAAGLPSDAAVHDDAGTQACDAAIVDDVTSHLAGLVYIYRRVLHLSLQMDANTHPAASRAAALPSRR